MLRGLPLLLGLMTGLLTPSVPGQVLELDDEDLQNFDPEESTIIEEGRVEHPVLSDVSGDTVDPSRYDVLIDELKAQIRQVRIQLRELPDEADGARSRLKAMAAAETELRRRAFERVVYRWPQPIFEDFDTALDEALDRQAIQQGLTREIRANEQSITELELEKAELERDLKQALELKEAEHISSTERRRP